MSYRDEFRKIKPMDEQADFVLGFCQKSREDREGIEPIWDEVEQNWLVLPYMETSLGSSTKYPLASTLSEAGTSHGRPFAVLKDPETHQAILTLVSKINGAVFPETGFVKARGVGFEDTFKATIATKLNEYTHRLPGHYLTFFNWLLSTGIFGTGIIKGFWHYQEELRFLRALEVDTFGGETISDTQGMVPTYDDPRYENKDIRDCFPDLGNCELRFMCGFAERFKVTAADAIRNLERGIWTEKDAVTDAIEAKVRDDQGEYEDIDSDDVTRLSHRKESLEDFVQMTGYEYYGEVPFKGGSDQESPEDGIYRRVVTVLGGKTVRSEPWPRRLPYFDMRIIPRLGSFYGISPAEVIRYDQDFADTLKMMLADAVVRATHPPLIYNKYGDVDLGRLHTFKPGVPVGADTRQGTAVEQLNYNPPVQPAFLMYSGVKQQMREASGALGAIQGLGLGSKRFSASEAVQTFEQAYDKPEMFAQIVEKEYLPPVGKYNLELYQEFEDDPAGISRRIGDANAIVRLSDINADFDVEYVGTRQETKAQRMATFREIVAASANPIVAQLIPWIPLLRKLFDEGGAHEIAAMVGNPQLVALHTLLNTINGGKNALAGNNNGTTPNQAPLGALPAQIAGGVATGA